jgi:hypothetical protein
MILVIGDKFWDQSDVYVWFRTEQGWDQDRVYVYEGN